MHSQKNQKNGFTPRAGLDDDLARIGTSLTKDDKLRLTKLCDALNNGWIKQAIKGSKFKDPFELTITRTQARQLFLLCVPKYDGVLRQKLGLKLYKELQNSKEMVTLFSLAYNAPSLIGKNLVQALRQGNRARVQYEILYGSNKNRDIVLDNRRKREAKNFGKYDGEIPTQDEVKAEEGIKEMHATQIVAYDSEMAAKRHTKLAKKTKGGRTAQGQTHRGQQPGSNPNQKSFRKRVYEVKAHSNNRGIVDRIHDLWDDADKVIHRDWSFHPASLNERSYHKRWS